MTTMNNLKKIIYKITPPPTTEILFNTLSRKVFESLQ